MIKRNQLLIHRAVASLAKFRLYKTEKSCAVSARASARCYERVMGRAMLLCWCLTGTSLLYLLSVDAIRIGTGVQNSNSSGTDEDAKHHKRNNRVLIGLLSQPSDPAGRHESYIAASYVKFLEAAGARVVPFVHDMDKAEIKRR